MTQAIHHLADAIDALEQAYDRTEDGLGSDHIQAAEAECYRALRQIADVRLASPDDPQEREANDLMDSFDGRLANMSKA